MQTNNFFQTSRMLHYLRKHASDNIRFYIVVSLSIFAIFTFIGVVGVATGTVYQSTTNIIPMYYIGLLGGSALLSSRAFNEFASKERAIDYLMVPASQFEKFLTTLLISTIGYLIVYHIGCYMSLSIIETFQNIKYNNTVKLEHDYNFFGEKKAYFYYGYFLIQAIFLLGATWFHKYGFLKTQLSFSALIVLIAILNCLLIFCLFGADGEMYKRTMPFVLVGENIHGPGDSMHTKVYLIPEWLRNYYLFIVKFLLAPILFTLTYFRLKDKEI